MPYYLKQKSRKSDLVKRLDTIFSLYIRLRDVMPSGYVRCIACGKIKPFAEVDCGHFFSRVHMGTRFDEDNCHAECRYCNRFSADHLVGYQQNLISKIGQARFDLLKVRAATPFHYMEFELKGKIAHYKAEVQRLSAEKRINVK